MSEPKDLSTTPGPTSVAAAGSSLTDFPAPAVASTATHAPIDGPPTTSNAKQRNVCVKVNDSFFGPHRPTLFRPSAAFVPTPVAETGFGPPDAQCETDPDSGIHYRVRIWADVERRRLNLFEHALLAGGFTVSRQSQNTRRFTAPPGIPIEAGDQPSDLREVEVTTSAGTDHAPTTMILWI
jgi:hypothetical protein